MSKFDRLFRVAKDESGLTDEDSKAAIPTRPEPQRVNSAPLVSEVKHPKNKGTTLKPVQGLSESEATDRTRVLGKRQHPDFVGLTTYIRKDVHRRVKIALLVEGNDRELSELVDELLANWLVNKNE